MENTIKDLVSDFKDRLTNPFTSAFIISWLINNYRIPVALIFYKQQDLWRDRYHSYIDLIKDNLSWREMFWIPIVVAAGYTFIFPWFKYLIHWYRAWVEVEDTNRLKKVQNLQTVTKQEYDRIRNELYEKIELVSRLTTTNSEQLSELITSATNTLSLEQQLERKQQEENDHLQQSREYDSFSKGEVITGTWEVVPGPTDTSAPIWIFYRSELTIDRKKFTIKNFVADPYTKMIAFSLVDNVNGKSIFMSFKYDKGKLTQTDAEKGIVLQRYIHSTGRF